MNTDLSKISDTFDEIGIKYTHIISKEVVDWIVHFCPCDNNINFKIISIIHLEDNFLCFDENKNYIGTISGSKYENWTPKQFGITAFGRKFYE